MFIGIALSLVLSAASPTPAAQPVAATKIADVLANPTSFDGQHLTVSGTIAQLAERTSRRGNDYATFDLCDTACLHIYVRSHPKIADGQTLTVSGKFYADRKVGSFDVKNELDADAGSIP